MKPPARIWRVAERRDELAPGCDAGLVAWGGDPLQPSSLALAVMVEGREVSLTTRQIELRDRYLLAVYGKPSRSPP